MRIKWKWCDELNRYNFNTSFTRPATFKSKHQSPPYNIFYASPWGLHPIVTFPQNSQVGIPKLGFLLSQTFGCSYLSQIKFGLRVQGQYFIALENIFSTMYNTLHWTSFNLCFQRIYGQESNSQFDAPLNSLIDSTMSPNVKTTKG